MKTRSPLTICLPLAIFVTACVLSLPTLVIAVVWMTIGVMALGHRSLESFPVTGINRRWLRGYRGACLWFWHLAWWPWYMRSSIQDVAGQIGHSLHRTRKSGDEDLKRSSDRRSNGDHD
ncbi:MULTISPECIES: hypothetical protein [Paraburkholderia]|jgi:hypothetical protein|uniref:hypothetical protein n=1 Tax=Paraburkholderia TaxID=1822464 RepID=UPI0022541351|nr:MULTISPECIES: hypothetical protein [Paraburkholderia]MCX4152945.1 hypothetical protein [Paraburkholderia aspalathi]MDN7162359.1 hypothetical protein [Paraburkholderia sp. SECH2]MDQ6390845.1 hypothetical protein [Paraburkholderia aspalathi]